MQANELREILIKKKAQYEMNKEAAERAIAQAEEITSSFKLEELEEWSELVGIDLRQILAIDFDKMTKDKNYAQESLVYLQEATQSMGKYLEKELQD